MRNFKMQYQIFRPCRGFKQLPNCQGFHFASPEEITDHYNKSKYNAKEIFRKLDEITVSFNLAIDQGIHNFKENERKYQLEETKNEKGIFENAHLSLITYIRKLF